MRDLPSIPSPAKLAPTIVLHALLVLAATPWSNPGIALTAGIALALFAPKSFPKRSPISSRFLIQACIVLLGLRLPLADLAHAAASGVAFAVATIVGTLALGLALARLFRVDREIATLVSSGTAICGGSAIAAVGASIRAASTSIAVATGAVFILNAVALYAFPPIGRFLQLSSEQFGTWCGVAIHDMSSVNGAAKAWAITTPGQSALDVANVVKLTRVLWIAPIALAAGWWFSRTRQSDPGAPKPKAPIPWFILYFVAASALRTLVPQIGDHAGAIKSVAAVGFQAALFLIGASLSPGALKAVGWRAFALAICLWLVVASATLVIIRATVP